MAVALRGAAVVPAGNPTTGFTVAIPSQVLTDDGCFLAVTSRDSVGAGTLSVTDNDTGGNAWTKIANSTDHKATLWYKRATSASASKTVTVANAVGSASGVLKCFSGTALATPYSNIAVETNNSADETHAGFTPARSDSMICAAVFNYANDNGVTSLSFATAGATTATEKLSTGGSDCGCIFGHVLQSGGPTGTGNLTWAQTDGTTYSIVWTIRQPIAVTADAGSYSQTGSAATLRRALKVAANSFSYALTGTAASLERVFTMAAAASSYAMTGTAATLTYDEVTGYTLTADAGSFSQTGTAAGVRWSHRLASDVGSYLQTGTAAALRATHIVSAASDSYAWTGSDVTLRKGQNLSAEAGSFSQTGTAASLRVAHQLAAAAGSFANTGTAAGVLFNRELQADVGSYAHTGTPASLFKGRSLQAESAIFAMTGSAAALRAARALSAQSASYDMAGTAADLQYASIAPPFGVMTMRYLNGRLTMRYL